MRCHFFSSTYQDKINEKRYDALHGNFWPVADILFGRAKPQAYYECDYDAGMRFPELHRVFPELLLIGNISRHLIRNDRLPEIVACMIECLDTSAPRVTSISANSISSRHAPENLFALLKAASKFRKRVRLNFSKKTLALLGIHA